MTRKISLITAVAGAALVLSVPAAWGKPQPVGPSVEFMMAEDGFDDAVAAKLALQSTPISSPDAVDRAQAAHLSQQSNPITSPDAVDRAAVSNQSQSQYIKALTARSEGLNKKYGLGEFAQKPESKTSPSQRAELLRSEGLNRMYGLGEFATGRVYIDDRSEWLDPNSLPVNVSATSSDRDIEWPQIGAGLGIGIVLAIGLVLALRLGRGRPLAHG